MKQQPLHKKQKEWAARLTKRIPVDKNSADTIQNLLLFSFDVVMFLLQEPLLLLAIWFSSLGAVCLAIYVCQHYPWVPLFSVGICCFLVRVVQLVECQGLLSVLPGAVTQALQRPIYELVSEIFNTGAIIVCNVLRLGMLACMELREEQRRELLTGMDSEFRALVFQQPAGLLLPWPVRRALLGRDVGSVRPAAGAEAAAATDPVLLAAKQDRMSRRRSASAGNSAAGDSEGGGSEAPAEEGAAEPRMVHVDSMIDLIRGVDEVAQNSKASAHFASVERILAQKMVTGTTAFAARNLASTAKAQAIETLEYGKEKAGEAVGVVKEAAADPRTRATAVGGGVALGTAGGATGLVSGGAIGAAIGIVPAVFTFGLSIPVGAAIGSGVGVVAGSVIAGTTGFLGGGALGWSAYGRKGNAELTAPVEDGSEGAVPVTDMPETVS